MNKSMYSKTSKEEIMNQKCYKRNETNLIKINIFNEKEN